MNDETQDIISTVEEEIGETLYQGDERRIFLEMIAYLFNVYTAQFNDRINQRTLEGATGDDLDALVELRGIERIESINATTTLRFHAIEGHEREVVIPALSKATNDFEHYFLTDSECKIEVGKDYVDISATAFEGGMEYNDLAPGTINIMVDLIDGVISVENITTTSSGQERESDIDLRDRFRLASGACSVAGPTNAYRYFAKSADATVFDAKVISPEAGVVNIYPVCYETIIPSTDILNRVLSVCSADDVRPLTDKVQVLAPVVKEYSIEFTYYTSKGIVLEIESQVQEAVNKYVAWQQGAIDRPINPDYLKKMLFQIDEIYKIDIVSPVYAELDNAIIAKFNGESQITHKVTNWE